MDQIIIKDLTVKGLLGPDHWSRGRSQILIINFTGYRDFKPTDRIEDTVSYSTIANHIQSLLEGQTPYKTLEAMVSKLALDCLQFGFKKATIKLEKAHALLHAESAGIEITRTIEDIPFLKSYGGQIIGDCAAPDTEDEIFIQNLSLTCYIGVNAFEKAEKQRVIVTIRLLFKPSLNDPKDSVPQKNNYRTVAHKVAEFIEQSKYETLEMMVNDVCNVILFDCDVEKVNVMIEKPSAVTFAKSAGVAVTRTRKMLPSVQPISDSQVIAFIAFGSNQGDRVENISNALESLEKNGVKILDSSFMYESAPMYVLDQPKFLNGVIKVNTALRPLELLKLLKDIEEKLGRDFTTIRNGPRVIDLDILFYGNTEYIDTNLQIPHPRIPERMFVLLPLCDIAHDFYHPTLFRTVGQMLRILEQSGTAVDPLERVMPVRREVWNFSKRTYIMGILNVTPDSFSDGGKFFTLEAAVQNAITMVSEGADVIDIGGQSTAPNTPEISVQEEIDRVVPVIKALRLKSQVPISVDTFRSEVAKAAVDAGADFINDVSGGKRDPNMLHIMKSCRVPVCLMHMRGNSLTMQSLTDYSGDVMKTMKSELSAAVQDAINAGIFRWNISVDPGFGFSKDFKQNYEILRRLPELSIPRFSHLHGMPILVGVSRKSFIGKTTNQPIPANRVFGSAAATAISVLGGARIVRCHDVREMKEVCSVSDEISSPF